MRPVNLLPEGDRLRRPSQGQPGNSSFVLLGVLGVLLLALVAFVMTQNQINSKTSDINRAQQKKTEAEQRAARLGAFGQFAQVKETRVRSVTDLATLRFDWERMMRELALVLPDDTWLTEVAAASTPQPEAAAAVTPGTPAPTGPSVSLSGCSKSQRQVAIALVRLRTLHRATDVQLTESAEDETVPTGPTGSAASSDDASSAAVAGQGGGCAFFKWQATVSFEPDTGTAPESEKGRVPAALGGGA